MIQIVCSASHIEYFKKCEYYKVNLGYTVSQIDKKGDRVVSGYDKFAHDYNTHYKTVIYSKGTVGDILFYVDLEIKDEQFAVYIENEEFVYRFDRKLAVSKSPAAYLGWIIRTSKERYEDVKAKRDTRQFNTQPLETEKMGGNADKLLIDPGNVTWEDLQQYILKKKR